MQKAPAEILYTVSSMVSEPGSGFDADGQEDEKYASGKSPFSTFGVTWASHHHAVSCDSHHNMILALTGKQA